MPGEGDLIAIRMKLLGGKEAAAEADAVSAAIAETGNASEAAAAKSTEASKVQAAASANAARAAKRSAASTRAVGKGMTKWITGSAIAVAGASIYMAANFKRQMGLVATDAGGTRKEVERLEPAVLALARSSQFGPEELAKGLFHAESAGYRGAKAMAAMKAASDLATVGGSGFEETMYAVVSATKALGREGPQAMKRTAAEINEIVAHGDIRLSELNAALSTGLLPTARGLGLSVQDVGSALDVMTARGMPAQKSAYALNFTLQKLIPSTEKAEEVFERLGIGQEQLLVTAQKKGLPAALDLLKKKLDQMPQGQQIKTVNEMFGGGRMSKGLLTVIQNLGEVKKIYRELTPDMAEYNKHIKEAEENPLVRMKRAWSSVQAALVEIGSDLLPIVVPAFEKMAGFVDKVAKGFDHLSPTMKSVVGEAIALAAVIGPLILLGGKLAKAWAAVRAITAVSSVGGAAGAGGSTLGARFGLGGLIAGGGLIASNAGGNAVGGKWGQWIKDVGGGASVGAGVGMTVGGPFGALIGGGLGAGAGAAINIVHNLTGAEKVLSVQHMRLARDGKAVARGMQEQRRAGRNLIGTEDRVQTAQAHSRTAAHRLWKARRELANAVHNYGADSRPAVRAEHRLTEAIEGHRKASRRLRNAERLRGVELSEYKTIARENVLNERNEINTLTAKAKHLNTEYTALKKSGAQQSEINEKAKAATHTNERLHKAQGKLNETLLESAHVAGPKFSKFLKDATRELLDAGSAMKALNRKVENFGSLATEAAEAGANLSPLGEVLEHHPGSHKPIGGHHGHGLNTGGGKNKGAAQSRHTGPVDLWSNSPDSRPREYTAPTGNGNGGSSGGKRLQPIVVQVGRRTLANVVAEVGQDDEARL